MNNIEKFHQLHSQAKPFILANVWNVKSAEVVERGGFEAMATSSGAIADSLGYKDGEQIPFSELLYVIKRIRSCTPFLNVFKRMGEGQGILSFPFKGYTLAIDFPVTKKLHTFTPKLDAKVLQAGGRLYLGKDAMLDEQMFKEMYPQFSDWMAIKKKYDPAGKFTSDIGRRLGLSK